MTLTLSHIVKSFGSVEVLKDITTAFQPGTVTAIVGDNGAGKSTLLKILAGIYQPNTGSVSINGVNITSQATGSHRQVGIEMVMQNLALAPQQDVVTNMFMGRELCGMGGFLQRRRMDKMATAALQKLQITIPDLAIPVGKLSGGQQQAVAIARAALFNPQVLLLDEPTAALAAREVEQVLSLMRQQRDLGRIVIFVSHRLNDVFAVADRVMVLKHGAIFADTPAMSTNLAETVARIVA